MTNKEAIEILSRQRPRKSGLEWSEAIDFAIKALKILEVDDIDIDGTYWLYYDDNGNLRENKE